MKTRKEINNMTKKFNKGSKNQNAPQLHGRFQLVVITVKETNEIKIKMTKQMGSVNKTKPVFL